jgi:hypothetical protein
MVLHWANQVARSEEYHSFHRTRTHNVERALRRIGNERPSHAGNQPRTGIVDVKPSYHSQSVRGNIDHSKITGGVGTFHKETAAVPSANTTALRGIYLRWWSPRLLQDLNGCGPASRATDLRCGSASFRFWKLSCSFLGISGSHGTVCVPWALGSGKRTAIYLAFEGR